MLETYSHLTNNSITLKMKEFHDRKESKDVRINKALDQIKKMLLTKPRVIEVGFEEIKKNPEEREQFVKLLMEVSKYQKAEKKEEHINEKSGDLNSERKSEREHYTKQEKQRESISKKVGDLHSQDSAEFRKLEKIEKNKGFINKKGYDLYPELDADGEIWTPDL